MLEYETAKFLYCNITVWFGIRNKQSGIAIQLGGKNGENIEKQGSNNYIWKWQGNGLVNKLGYALGIGGGHQEKYHGGVHQQWIMIGDKIISVFNGMCLDIPRGSKDSNVGIILWSLHSDDSVDNQSWELVYE